MADDPYGYKTGDVFAELRRGWERRQELDHEQQIAEVRARSRALVWRGTETELVETISKWYESGSLVAADLQDALRLASLHFVRDNGTPVLRPHDIPAIADQAEPSVQQSQSNKELIEHRRALLAEYKGATKASNKQIYEARNSGVHKPEFYEWINGKLPNHSTPAKSLERFLAEKKPPIPRKP
jgi:hypothetical protein